MAISTEQAILNILKVYYVDKVQNLLFRNSPVLKEIGKMRVEGKEQRFPAIYSRGGAVAGDATVAETKSAQNVKNAEFAVTPGQLFSIFTYNAKEVQASLSKKGAYMKVAGNKAFAATEAFRKTLAAALYGRGYGEVSMLAAGTTLTASATATLTLSNSAIMKIDVGSTLVVKPSVASSTVNAKLDVDAINGNDVTVTVISATGGAYTTLATDVLALDGSMDASGNPLLPVGLAGWIPAVNGRTGATWTSYITPTFMGVQRLVNVEGLAGNFVNGISVDTKKKDTVQKLIQRCRRRGSEADLIVMNDEDFLELSQEIETTNTYFTATSTKEKKKASVGISEVSASFSTNFIDNIYDDPYLEKGIFYVLDRDALELWTYTNAEAVNDGIAGNNPGKQNPEEFDNAGRENDPYKLLLEDFITVEPGSLTTNGSSVRVILNFFGSFVVLNPSNVGVGFFHDAVVAKLTAYSA